MMIMFQRQIETVGSHQALISTAADGAKRRCDRIRFHRRRGRVPRHRGARLQTDKRCKWRPHQVHCAFRDNEILGGWGDPDRHYEIIRFHPLSETTGQRLVITTHIRREQTESKSKSISSFEWCKACSSRHSLLETAELAPEHLNTQVQPTLACDEIAVEFFIFK